ncbi:MAG: right-handed parallel beta-helix repeat-containing protein [Chitinivibrionales bacterium]|nr:right-handed parallel beta-helix repeat-containing protein [Chitinivibrionales bacterium]
MIIKKRTVSYILLAAAMLFNADAKTFYIDPASGNLSNDGSQAHPWKTLQEVLDNNKVQSRAYSTNPYAPGDTLKVINQGAPVNAGDTLLLNSGYHGDISIQAAVNADYITIAAAAGQIPQVNHILISGASRWKIQGLTVSAAFDTVGHNRDLLYINTNGWAGPSSAITVENCSLYTVKDASAWSMNDWGSYACTGARLHGKNFIFRNNFVSNVNIGVRVIADSCLIEKNIFDGFSECGMRLAGTSNCAFNYNVVQGFHMVNNIYGLGFQGYSTGPDGTVGAGVVSHISVVGNIIINTLSPAQPFKGQMYGIACFDGWYNDWTVENNVVMTNTWYGIALNGAVNCRIVNNTVCRLDTADASLPCITVSDYSAGAKSTGSVLRNNFCGSIVNNGDTTCRADHNITAYNPDSFFVDYANKDLRLKPGCAAIDSGSADLAPVNDIAGTIRPQGGGIDIGAYEYFVPVAVMRPRLGPAEDGVRKLIVGYNRFDRSIYASLKTTASMRLLNEKNGYVFSVVDILGKQRGTVRYSDKSYLRWRSADPENGTGPGVYIVTVKNGSLSMSSRVMVR